ncbi:hypothetical protein [Burkholderia stagnalis]|nr:hypothetical protein [Burkholderia stagnalis]
MTASGGGFNRSTWRSESSTIEGHRRCASQCLINEKSMNQRLLTQCAVLFLFLVSGKPTWAAPLAESNQIVIAVDYGSLDLTRLHQLEDELESVARETKLGELDGDEVTVDGGKGGIRNSVCEAGLRFRLQC